MDAVLDVLPGILVAVVIGIIFFRIVTGKGG